MNAQERTEQELRIQNAAFWLKQQEKEFPDWYDAGEPVFKLLAAYAKFREQYRASSLPQATPQDEQWLEFNVKNMCSLCGQVGIIDTRGIKTPANFECGGLHYCICPNGRTLKAHNAPKEEWLKQAAPKGA